MAASPKPSPCLAAGVLAALGDPNEMFAMLEHAVAERDPLVSEMGAVPIFDAFRDDPRMGRLHSRPGPLSRRGGTPPGGVAHSAQVDYFVSQS